MVLLFFTFWQECCPRTNKTKYQEHIMLYRYHLNNRLLWLSKRAHTWQQKMVEVEQVWCVFMNSAHITTAEVTQWPSFITLLFYSALLLFKHLWTQHTKHVCSYYMCVLWPSDFTMMKHDIKTIQSKQTKKLSVCDIFKTTFTSNLQLALKPTWTRA